MTARQQCLRGEGCFPRLYVYYMPSLPPSPTLAVSSIPAPKNVWLAILLSPQEEGGRHRAWHSHFAEFLCPGDNHVRRRPRLPARHASPAAFCFRSLAGCESPPAVRKRWQKAGDGQSPPGLPTPTAHTHSLAHGAAVSHCADRAARENCTTHSGVEYLSLAPSALAPAPATSDASLCCSQRLDRLRCALRAAHSARPLVQCPHGRPACPPMAGGQAGLARRARSSPYWVSSARLFELPQLGFAAIRLLRAVLLPRPLSPRRRLAPLRPAVHQDCGMG